MVGRASWCKGKEYGIKVVICKIHFQVRQVKSEKREISGR